MATHTMAVELGTARFKVILDDEDIFQGWVYRMLLDGFVYERDTSIAIHDILKDGDCFVDVGANLGWFTLLGAATVGPTGRVLAFEPNPRNYTSLCENIRINGFDDRVIASNKAINDSIGATRLWVNEQHGAVSSMWDFSKHPAGHIDEERNVILDVPTTTLDDELDALDVTLGGVNVRCVKIDIEGAEVSAMRGMQRWLASGRIPYVFAEMNYFGMTQLGYGPDEMNDAMLKHGYSAYLMGDALELMTRDYVYNILFSNQPLDAVENVDASQDSQNQTEQIHSEYSGWNQGEIHHIEKGEGTGAATECG